VSKKIWESLLYSLLRLVISEAKKMEERKLTEIEVRNYLHNISEAIEKLSREELHISGEKDSCYLLTSLSKDNEAFFVNLAIITIDQKKQVQIETALFDWLKEHPLFSTHECDFNRRPLTRAT
jgi:hypothetical protein